MALPGIRTVIQDRFYTLARTDAPVGPRVLAIGTRDTADGTGGVADYDPYLASNERAVITAFGEGSQLHKAFLELVAGGANRPYLVALPSDTVDSDLTDTADGNRFDQAFEAAESAQPDVIVPFGRGANSLDWDDYDDPATPGGAQEFGFYADDSNGDDSMSIRIAAKCKAITERSHPVFAVLGVKPWVGGTNNMTAANVATHLAFTDLVDRDATIAGTDNSYVSVVSTELRPVGYPTEFGWSNGAAHYAGYVSSLSAMIAPTGKNVFNVESIRYNPSRAQAEELIDKGLVPVMLDYSRAPQWVDALTFGKSSSDYTRLTTLRIVFETTQAVRIACQRFVGSPATTANRNALETAITSVLRAQQITGALVSSDFTTTYLSSSNQVIVDLVLQPAFEIRNIDVAVSVNLGS